MGIRHETFKPFENLIWKTTTFLKRQEIEGNKIIIFLPKANLQKKILLRILRSAIQNYFHHYNVPASGPTAPPAINKSY